MPIDSWLRFSQRHLQLADDPLRLLQAVAGGMLLGATVLAGLAAWWWDEPRALMLMGLLWALYGLVTAVVGGVLEPLVDFAATALVNAGLNRAGGGFSDVETLVARGHYAAAAEAYRERAVAPGRRVEATLRRAALLAGPLEAPEAAAAELESLTRSGRLSPEQDIRAGLALVDLFDYRLADPGRAMAELRRLIDRYPEARRARLLRAHLTALKADHFGSGGTP